MVSVRQGSEHWGNGELAGEEFQVPYCTHLNRYMLGG